MISVALKNRFNKIRQNTWNEFDRQKSELNQILPSGVYVCSATVFVQQCYLNRKLTIKIITLNLLKVELNQTWRLQHSNWNTTTLFWNSAWLQLHIGTGSTNSEAPGVTAFTVLSNLRNSVKMKHHTPKKPLQC